MTIHTMRIKFFVFLSILIAAAQITMAQTGNWDSYKASGYESGTGTKDDPYVIKTAEQLAYFASRVTAAQDMWANVELRSNIDLGGHYWVPIGNPSGVKPNASFGGVFNGNGFTIRNMKQDFANYENTALFANLRDNSVVRNLNFDGADIKCSSQWNNTRRVGIVAAATYGNPTIENVSIRNSKIHVDGNFTQNHYYLIGGLIGGSFSTTTIKNCYVDVDIDLSKVNFNGLDKAWIGEVVGAVDNDANTTLVTMKNVYFTGSLKLSENKSYDNLGTMIGRFPQKGSYTDCYYKQLPTDKDGNALTLDDAHNTGTQNSGYDFVSAANKNLSDNMLRWETDGKGPKVYTKAREIKQSHTDHTSKKMDVEVIYNDKDTDKDTYTYEWTISPDRNMVKDATGKKITFDCYYKDITGSVKVMEGSNLIEVLSFTVKPLKYSEDLYADQFYSSGNGTKEDPYIIDDDMQLAKFAHDVTNAFPEQGNTGLGVYSGTYFKLGSDIDLSSALWMPVGTWVNKNTRYFSGKFDGDGHTISNMRILWKGMSGDLWSVWGLFSRLQGSSSDENGFCSVSNFILDHANVQKEPGTVLIGSGHNVGTVAGELYQNTELSNIIVKNAEITDNDESYTTAYELRIGGIVGNLNNSGVFRIYNLSADTKIEMLNKATLGKGKDLRIAQGIGRYELAQNSNSYHIYPTNIFVTGKGVKVNATGTRLYRGTVITPPTSYPNQEQLTTWYYEDFNSTYSSGTRDVKIGNQKTPADFGSTFAQQNNKYLDDKDFTDKYFWIYSQKDGFSFGKTTIKIDRQENDVLTAETEKGNADNEKYYWYTSTDKKTWTKVSETASNPLTLERKEYDQYVYAVLEDGSSCSRYVKVGAMTVSAKLVTDSIPDTYVIKVTNNIWNNNDNFTITYTWVRNGIEVSNEATYKPGDVADSDKISCHVVVTDKSGKIVVLDKWVYKVTVVYLKPTGDISLEQDWIDDNTYGYSPEKPMRTWRGAYSKLTKNASWDENVIVLMQPSGHVVTQGVRDALTDSSGKKTESDADYNNYKKGIIGTGFNMTYNYKGVDNYLTLEDWNTAVEDGIMTRNATITGKWDNNDYTADASIEFYGDTWGLPLWGDTRFENITFKHAPNSGGYDIIYCQYHNLEMGENVIMSNTPMANSDYGSIDGAQTVSVQIFGGLKNDGRFYDRNDPAKLMQWAKYQPNGKDGFSIKLRSGWYSCVCIGGRHTTTTFNGTMGLPDMPVKGTIDIDIDQDFNNKHIKATGTPNYDVGIVLAGNHEGAMFADADIIIRSGRIGRVVNGTLGNVRNLTFTYVNGTQRKNYTYPNNSFMGRANILLDPASSEHAIPGETKAQTNERVIVTEMYGGGTGRGYSGGQTIDNPFYGISTITINGGTFKLLPEGNNSAGNLMIGIYGAGAGGMNGIGNDKHHTNDQRIPYWNSDKTVMLFGPYDTAKNNLITYKCYNADTHTYTDIDPRNTSTKIVINGGVFGSEKQPIDGIYAGGSGYMSRGLFSQTQVIPNKDGGNVYGLEGETVSSLTINGGEFYCNNGVFAGGRGTDFYYSNRAYNGTPSDYTDLGKTYGNVEMNINGGTFYCPVFGGGYGVADAALNGDKTKTETLYNMARVYGKSTVNIYGGTFFKNIYGGGDMAVTEYHGTGNATNLTIGNNATIYGSVFAGGNGRASAVKVDSVGTVIGNTSLAFVGDIKQAPTVYGDIYGGGNLALVKGSTNVNLYAANFAGQIFGGGKGLLNEDLTVKRSANVERNTNVSLAKDLNDQNYDGEGKDEDIYSINVIWDRLWREEQKQVLYYTSNKDLFFDKGKYKNPHNIFGGGNLACNVSGKATVKVQKGMTPFELLKTQDWKDSYSDNDNPHFYVFGGGYGEHTTVDSTDVTVDVEGDYGKYNAEIGDDDQLSKDHDGSLFDDDSSSVARKNRKARKAPRKEEANPTKPVFDNSKGIPNFTVLGVMGGGYSGIVTGNTKVTVDGQTFIHRVYGGGFGNPNSTADNETGQVKGNTEVFVQGAKIYGDVFGGGAGVASNLTGTSKIDFINVARVIGTTSVEVSDDANVYGNVYGGGDIANVGPADYTHPANYKNDQPVSKTDINQTTGAIGDYTHSNSRTFVNIVGGDIYGEVFGGGKGKRKAEANEYYNLGRINGNTLVHVANTNTFVSHAEDNGNYIPYIWNRIYGGCAYGTVDGNTLVHIEGGMLGLNIFGGGYGNVEINSKEIDNSQSTGASTPMDILSQVLGKKDTNNTATYANILGNTKVQIDGGSWIWNQRADINGNKLIWTASDADNEKVCDDYVDFRKLAFAMQNSKQADAATLARIQKITAMIQTDKSTQEFFDLNSLAFKKNHNIFGGGNRACFVGTYNTTGTAGSKSDDFVKPADGSGDAVVILNHSPLTEIKDSKGNMVNLLDETRIQGMCWAFANSNTAHPQFSVFGAGYGANTKVGNAYVYAQPGVKVGADGKAIADADGNTIRYINQQTDGEAYNKLVGQYGEDYEKISRDDKKIYYGAGADDTDNAETYQRYRASRVAWVLGAPNLAFFEIHGGGFSGYVAGNTYVETDCQLHCRNVFGAGLGSKPAGDIVDGQEYDFGSIGGTSKVFIKGGYVSRNVYGGGAGIESVRVSDSKIVNFNEKSGKILDFPDMARTQKTEVHIYGEELKPNNNIIDRTMVFGSIYGGGDVANVGKTTDETTAQEITTDKYLEASRTTLVNVRGGALFSQIFAGGSGRANSLCNDYTKLGGVYGNTCVIVDRPAKDMTYPYTTTTGTTKDPSNDTYMQSPADGVNDQILPYVFNRVYGGCENGTVYGNTIVAINDGNIGHNVFGGGWGQVDTTYVDNRQVLDVTSADVTGNTNIVINGGRAMLTSYWNPETRFWEPSAIIGEKTYSPQYDPSARKFYINHNIYAGGNVACVVGKKDDTTGSLNGSGNTYLTMVKGMLYDNTRVLSNNVNTNNKKFFECDEWKEVYEKVGSPHFGVFGGGYGEQTSILADTHVKVEMQKHGSLNVPDLKTEEEYKHFVSGYSVMDIVGGGYAGNVVGDTHITGDGGVFCRRMFGGGFYNSVNATNVEVKAIDCHDIFGGGLMGDVLKNTNINIGYGSDETSTNGLGNKDVRIHGDIYGGNDVSGYVNVKLDEQGFFADNGGDGTHINIKGGHIYGNVYGAGNGDYLYALDKKGHTQVTVNEHYPLNPNDPNSETEPLVYTVPMRETMPSYKAASDAAKIVNINSWRPLTNKVSITLAGNSTTDTLSIKGDVYGGGNSATVQKVQDSNTRANVTTTGFININIGNHTRIRRVFMGCNGDALFTTTEDNNFMNKFQKLNGDIDDYSKELNLGDTIDWKNDPSNKGISTLYLSTKNDDRPTVYPHLLDLYFQPVETDIQATLNWNGSKTGADLTDCVIGTFCCGGNRGNMNVYPDGKGNAFEYTFPKGLTIIDKIVGGCNNANYSYKGKVFHEGGYLLGMAHSDYPFIKLNVNNKFEPTVDTTEGAYIGGNVYGGCYQTGSIRGDITINLTSDMLEGKSKEKLEKSNELLSSKPKYSALNVYGAGYGMESYVYGNTEIDVAENVACKAPSTTTTDGGYSNTFNATGTSANFIYGGGQQGNVIGVTDVDIYNGHIFKAVTGGSYSGYVWGSTQVKVGYPKYYRVKDNKSGIYLLNRTDQNNKYIDREDKTENGTLRTDLASETIKQSIKLISGDIVTQAVYDSIVGKQGVDKFVKSDYFTAETSAPKSPLTWDDINIQIGEAVYGGGYSVGQGTSVLANATTVLKFTDKYNIDNAFNTSDAYVAELKSLPNGTTEGFGGNTTILVADRTSASGTSTDRDHITISHQDMKPIVLPNGTDLFGYYYKHEDGNYRYISLQDKYFYGTTNLPEKQDPDDKKIYQYDSEGGIFGDGHQSYAEGFRSADLTGYGFAEHTVNKPKIINTFQRLDILRLEDNCFNVLGARDYATNATNKTPYSLSRIGEIQMYANNVSLSGNNLKEKGDLRSRNYLGLANNIHYVGAVTSNVAFNDAAKEPWHNGDGSLPTEGNFAGKSYQEVKQSYIDDYDQGEDKDNVSIFQKRNDGTAKNMIGIASGYALKIQNAQECYEGEGAAKKVVDHIYYGPIYGVVEMNLIDVRADEGGGYVYADNVHKRTAKNGEAAHAVDFLETTGNFVFPYTADEGHFIVDDCFPTGYYNLGGEDPDTKVDVHYWYVTGFNYYYNTHITGYTYQSPNKFYSDNTDGLTVLSGLKAKQPVTIVSWKMRSGHPESTDEYSCDLEYRNYLKENTEGNVDIDGNDVSGKYKLYIGASALTKYDEKENGFAALLPMNGTGDYDGKNYIQQELPAGLKDDAKISFMLDDNVNNTTSEYFEKHLSKKCQATIVLSAPAYKSYTDENTNEPIISKVGSSEFFTYDAATDKYTKVEDGTNLVSGTDYYIYNGIAEKYAKIDPAKVYRKNDTGYTQITDITTVKTGSELYYCDVARYYTYTIYLTIEYVQGPNIKGNITIENCALPGEMIRIKKNNVVITADESFSANGYYWRIGKRTKDAEGKWTFQGDTDWEIGSAVPGYDTYKQGDTEGSGVFSGCVYDKTEDYLDIPAYYYMNGYGVQLGITMNGLDKIFPVDMQTNDTLVVHNFHRMDPHQTGVQLHLAEAVARANAEKDFAEPRIYIADRNDLTAFVNFVDTIGTGKDGGYVEGGKEYVKIGAKKEGDEWVANLFEVPRYGAKAQFVIQNDLNISSDYDGSAHSVFAGTSHGNGHVITGLKPGNCLFNSITGNVYNLGLASGKISNMQPVDGKISNYHCCFEYNPGASSVKSQAKKSSDGTSSFDGVSTPVVYHMDGTADTHYTADDFRFGRVAYDLNEYYLRARYSNDVNNKADMEALKYVYDYYANGDYQYAHRSDGITGRETGLTFLRTGKDSDMPNYGQAATRHDQTHTIDKARLVTADDSSSSSDGVSTPVALSSAIYQPLFNANNDATSDILMNDFLFWGQSLQSTPASYPNTIGYKEYNDNVWAHLLRRMTNRVYRTAGYYGDTKLDAFHYNAYNYGGSSMDTYVHNTATTAIDFTCKNDLQKAIGMTESSTKANAIYYPPVNDNATVFHGLSMKGGVTQNLLVYTAADNANVDNEAYDVADKALAYDETKKEASIEGHHIYNDVNGTGFTTPLLHLVERNPEGLNSEGDNCDNNDFCAPIEFSVTDRAWYTRKPQYYATETTGAWEGICLPFTVHKAVASINGELTHFYGTPSADEISDPAKNTHTLHHEYWLRGLVSVGQNEGKTTATYQRPGDNLFAPVSTDGTSLSEVDDSYNFANPFFIETYGDRLYNKTDNPYYTTAHIYDDYQLQAANVPYVVRFPGERYYEFDLSSAFFNNITGRNTSGNKVSAQTVTFNAYGLDNPSHKTTFKDDIIIPVSETSSTATTVGGFTHQGTYKAVKVAEKSVYGMNNNGTAFSDASTLSTVMPFRTYMSVAASSSKSRSAAQSSIYISEPTGIDKIVPEANDNDDEVSDDYIKVRPIGEHRVSIESTQATTLLVYTAAGQLYRTLDVQPGTAVYGGFQSGLYLFGKTKVSVR